MEWAVRHNVLSVCRSSKTPDFEEDRRGIRALATSALQLHRRNIRETDRYLYMQINVD